MKHNKPLLITSLLVLMASPVAYSSGDGGAGEGANPIAGQAPGDTQTISVTVPEVSLIDVTSTLTATLLAPTDAGDNIAEITIPGTPTYDISANVREGTTNTRKIVATTSVPADWKFTFNMTAPTGASSLGDVEFISTDTSVDLVENIGNIAQKNIGMTIKVGPEDANKMPSYTVGAKDIDIVYTITADL